jgi:hypothetical protein
MAAYFVAVADHTVPSAACHTPADSVGDPEEAVVHTRYAVAVTYDTAILVATSVRSFQDYKVFALPVVVGMHSGSLLAAQAVAVEKVEELVLPSMLVIVLVVEMTCLDILIQTCLGMIVVAWVRRGGRGLASVMEQLDY